MGSLGWNFVTWTLWLSWFFLQKEENQSVVHLVRNSNLHGNSLLFSDLNLRIGIHWGELSLHELYDHHGFFFTTIKSCEFLTRFKCFEYYESYFIRHPSSLITPNNRNKILWWNDEFYFLLCSCSNWFGFWFKDKFGTGFIFSMNKIFNDHLEHSEIKQTLFHLHHWSCAIIHSYNYGWK